MVVQAGFVLEADVPQHPHLAVFQQVEVVGPSPLVGQEGVEHGGLAQLVRVDPAGGQDRSADPPQSPLFALRAGEKEDLAPQRQQADVLHAVGARSPEGQLADRGALEKDGPPVDDPLRVQRIQVDVGAAHHQLLAQGGDKGVLHLGKLRGVRKQGVLGLPRPLEEADPGDLAPPPFHPAGDDRPALVRKGLADVVDVLPLHAGEGEFFPFDYGRFLPEVLQQRPAASDHIGSSFGIFRNCPEPLRALRPSDRSRPGSPQSFSARRRRTPARAEWR